MALVGCYSLDLYCDAGGAVYGERCAFKGYVSPQGEYTGRTESECIRDAKADGWKFNRERTKALCPGCVSAGVKFPKPSEAG